MGLVRLPSKHDYFVNPEVAKQEAFWPHHPAVKLSYGMFRYLWRNFHTSFVPTRNGTPTQQDDIDVGRRDSIEDDDDDEEVDDDEELQLPDEPQARANCWYAKVETLVIHVNAVSKRLCRHPGFAVAIDEMMKKFKGRSINTHKMRGKPIKEGFKFFAICDSLSGYVFDFFPDGRNADKTNVYDNVMRLIDTLPLRDTKKYVVVMDNYFTTPKVLKESRNRKVAIIGTTRKRDKWPSVEFRAITDGRFNTLYCWQHEDNYLVCRWIDNKDVWMVSTIHTGYETVTNKRRKPRITETNRNNLPIVYGNEHTITIDIPKVIDDYNHWMGGVDVADQLISYYRPNVRCRRVWMPIFFHCIDIIRINGYCICKSRNEKLQHKEYIQSLILSLNKRAVVDEQGRSRAAVANDTPQGSGKRSMKRRRMSHTNPTLPDCRLEGNKTDHLMIVTEKQRTCYHCSYTSAYNKLNGLPTFTPSTPKRACSYCKVQLCSMCFCEFHGWN